MIIVPGWGGTEKQLLSKTTLPLFLPVKWCLLYLGLVFRVPDLLLCVSSFIHNHPNSVQTTFLM